MKKFILEFIRRGLLACGLGPLVLVVLYLILQQKSNLQVLTVYDVCIGIITLTLLAFIAGGMNTIYQIEKIPLMLAIFIHGFVLYISYLATYLLNGWLEAGHAPILIFTGIFVMGYILIWVIIYSITKRRAGVLNEQLKKKQEITDQKI